MKRMISLALAAVLVSGTAVPMASSAATTVSPATVASTTKSVERIREQDDFYKAVNQDWLASNKIPEGRASWGNFQILDQDVDAKLRSLVEGYGKQQNLKANSDEQKLADLYQSALDTASRDRDGIKPVQPYLNSIARIKNLKDLQTAVTDLTKSGYSTVFTYGVGADLKNSNLNVLNISVGSFGMDDRDYYLANNPNTVVIQKAYKNYLKNLFVLKGDTLKVATTKAETVYNYEKSLAAGLLSAEESNDPTLQYHIYTVTQLKKMSPALDWSLNLKNLGLGSVNQVVVTQPAYFAKLNAQLKAEKIDTLKTYMEAVVLRDSASYLSSSFEKAAFEYNKVFSGVGKMRPIEERAFDLVNGSLGELLGKSFAEKYFSKEAKEDVRNMAKELLQAYETRINNLDWMSKSTKASAIKKLHTMDIKVGYPDQWQDYSAVQIKTYKNGGTLLGNIQSVEKMMMAKELKKLNVPVDKTEWAMTPQTINAYYNPSVNEIVFPAAILQEPFYKYGAPKAANLGGIGVVIGHEISHAFDDNGSKFDEKGNMVDWWTAEDFAKYNAKTKKLAEQFNQYEILPGEHVNGKLTLGENIADLGGVTAALEVLKKEGTPDYKTFFTAYSTLWRNLSTDELTRAMLQTNPHTPGIFRVNGVVTNLDEFYSTYGVTEKDKLYKKPEDRVKIW